MDTLGQMVKRLRTVRGLSQRALAIYAGVNNTDISRIEKDETTYFRPDLLRKIAKPLGVPVSELLKAAGYLPVEEAPSSGHRDEDACEECIPARWIPVVETTRYSDLSRARSAPAARLPIPADMDADYALTIRDDSMEPQYRDGDRVLVRESPEAYNGQQVVADIDGMLAVKTYYRYDGTIVLRSANPKYEDIADRGIRVVGVVKGAVTKRE